MPEDYPPENFTWEQLQSARACGLSFVSRDRYPSFDTLCGLAAGRPSALGQDETVLRGAQRMVPDLTGVHLFVQNIQLVQALHKTCRVLGLSC